MTEGLFWLVCRMDGGAIDWSEEWEIYYLYAKSDSISHKDAWELFAQKERRPFRRLNYDHYPRGRVVVRHGSATVFLNRQIATDEVLAAVNQVFGLTAPRIHAEGSRHYECYIDREHDD